MNLLERLWIKQRSVEAIPTRYEGVRFRSSLEADWAFTFDDLGITWSYEPVALRLGPRIGYRPDFYLPVQHVWCEVKGPSDVRIEKPRRLATVLIDDEFDQRQPLVVILRIPVRGCVVVEGAWPGNAIGLVECEHCQNWTFVDLTGAWSCRVCRQPMNLIGYPLDSDGPPFRQLDPYDRETTP